MKESDKYEKLMEFIYDEYQRRNNFKGRGERAGVLVTRFQRSSEIRFGDGYEQRSAMRYLHNQGWIEIVTVDGKRLKGPLYSRDLILPTREGIEHVEKRRDPRQLLLKAAPDAAEIVGRGLKGLLGM